MNAVERHTEGQEGRWKALGSPHASVRQGHISPLTAEMDVDRVSFAMNDLSVLSHATNTHVGLSILAVH